MAADDSVHVDVTEGGRVSVRDILFDAQRRLAAAGIPSPEVDAAEIVAHVMGTTRSRLILQDEPTGEQRLRIEQLVAKRRSRVPLQHLTGSTGFRRLEIQVGPGVFIPRPETELVAEAAIRELSGQRIGERIAVDLCAGSGAIALALGTEVPGSRIHAVEVDEGAAEWARRNVAAQDEALVAAGSRVEVIVDDAGEVADAGHPLARLAGNVPVVVSNPPYVPIGMVPREPEVRDFEPRLALYGGEDGLAVVRRILRTAAVLLRPGGLVVIEHADVQGAGPAGVPELVKGMHSDHALETATGIPAGRPLWTSVVDRIDLNGLPRFTLARRT